MSSSHPVQMETDLNRPSHYKHPSTPASDSAPQEANPSPLLLNPLSLNDWVEHSSRSKLKRPVNSFKKMLNENVQGLEKGYLLHLLNEDMKVEELVLLDCQDNQSMLRVLFLPQKKDRQQYHSNSSDQTNCLYFPVKKIHRLEFGSPSPSALSKGFALVLTEPSGELKSFKFEAQSIRQKESICSALLDACSRSKERAVSKEKTPSQRIPLPCAQTKVGQVSKGKGLLSRRAQTPIRTEEVYMNDVTSDPIHDDGCLESSLIYSDQEFEALTTLVPSVAMPDLEDTRQDEKVSSGDEKKRSSDFNDRVGDEPHVLSSSLTDLSAQWFVDNICMFALGDTTISWESMFCNEKEDIADGPFFCTNELEKYGCSVADWEKQLTLQNYFVCALSSPNMVAELCDGGGVWGLNTVDSGISVEKKAFVESNSMFRNRAAVVSAQAIRKKTLLQQMTFGGALEGSRRKMRQLQITKSMDDADREEKMVSNTTVWKENEDCSTNISQIRAPYMFQSLLESSTSEDIHDDLHDSDCCYDSDPEDMRVLNCRKGPRWVHADRLNQTENGGERSPLFSFEGSMYMHEENVQRVLQEIKAETMHLLWHPTQTSWDPNSPPTCVNFWVEIGMCLNNNICVQPKLMWSAAHERNLNSRELNMSTEGKPNFIELLGVNGILKGQPVDRRAHPFANKQKCFLIETSNQAFLFEAQTASERDQIVVGLRLLVARLVSMLMVKDQRVVKEYFGSAAAEVPGTAPEWAS